MRPTKGDIAKLLVVGTVLAIGGVGLVHKGNDQLIIPGVFLGIVGMILVAMAGDMARERQMKKTFRTDGLDQNRYWREKKLPRYPGDE